ncbi:MAG: glycoside hydrolase family 2 TIM barrel-domain containing protein [Acutalibacteraceae bacterium]|nr:glycoside hydrolase family 2 TIM barrel-domain containing protein [Acutalibacteraceae bacterium]
MVQSLNGLWKRRVGKGDFKDVQVPYSTLSVGHSECVKIFDIESKSEKILLKFDGITYYAKVTLNGVYLGDMLPYSEYTFDITDTAKEKDNELLVEIEDIEPKFGPSEGWENYSGIIRDVSIVYKNKNYIEDVFFKTTLSSDYKNAQYVVDVKAIDNSDVKWEVSLLKDDILIDSYEFINGDTITRTVENVQLWSPEKPTLYALNVKLYCDGVLTDEYNCKVGFREFKCNRHRFVLNGEELFVKGVCKHEMVADSGHVPTIEQIEKDLLMIKSTGCNFVRLVHYPHCKQTLEIADRLGLMVSEEPGLWWSDTSDPEISAGSLEVLRRTILRDRNHASIIFWLSFNECRFTEQFLKDSAQVCKELDPTRLVSGANCMSDEDTLKYYNICGFDFYTMHPYSDTFARSLKSAQLLNDKPLMFTEWGGYFVYDNPHLLTDFMNSMYSLYEANSDEGALAGESIWYWAELNDFNRGRPACIDGALKEALVDKYRNPTMIYKPFCDAIANFGKTLKCEDMYEFTLSDSLNKTPMSCENAGNFEAFKEKLAENIPSYHSRMRGRRITVGAVLQKEELDGMLKVPAVISKGNSPVFMGLKETNAVTVIGCVSAPYGYPLCGKYGEEAVKVTVECEDANESFILKNGMELTTVHTTLSSSRINPVAQNATEFARFSYDKNHENYIINRADLVLSSQKKVKKVIFESLNDNYQVLVYGVYL